MWLRRPLTADNGWSSNDINVTDRLYQGDGYVNDWVTFQAHVLEGFERTGQPKAALLFDRVHSIAYDLDHSEGEQAVHRRTFELFGELVCVLP